MGKTNNNSERLFPHGHLLGIEGLSAQDITTILDTADNYVERNRKLDKHHPILKGQTLINLFFENSTRTRISFELAGKRMGADVITMSAATSSIKKGETLIDTAMTLEAMHTDFIVVRHPDPGTSALLATKVKCPVINAGDGTHEHPTQALLDALTIRRRLGKLEGLTVAICGDLKHSRVARSNRILLEKMGATVRLVCPKQLAPDAEELGKSELFHNLDEGIKGSDMVMMLRLQLERMETTQIPSAEAYFKEWGLDESRLSFANPDALVMHPGPINRGVEIDASLADDISRSVILDQVEMGVAVRQAILELLASNKTP